MRPLALAALAAVLTACASPAQLPPGTAGSPPPFPSNAFPPVDPCADIPTPAPYLDAHHPAPRIGAALAYDDRSRRLILFSGVRGDSSCELAASWIFQDTWAWDGNGWTKLHPASSPLGRSFGAFAFDAHRGETVLFGGGSANSDLQRLDTWVWDGTNWRMKRPVTYPSAPAGSATYDASLSGVVALTDRAWLWDGTNWAAMPGDVPTGAWQYALADDPAHHQLVLYGTFARSTGTSYETWTWDGAAWQLRRPAHPPAAGTPYAAYDPVHNDVLMFDGATYSWNGVDWTQEHPAISPRPRLFASMAYDAAIGRIVLFGGKSVDRDAAGQYTETVNNELWSWDGASWHLER